ncbi:MAG: ATP-binding protein, partial [Minisyncoccia bacterium]
LDLWMVTDRRIISVDQTGLFRRKVTSLALESIQEITVKSENPLEALFHYGTIEIETAGPDDEDSRMEGIPNPEHMRNVIIERVSGFRKQVENVADQAALYRTVSHEVKNYLAKDAAALAEIAEGEYDARPGKVKSVATEALSETRKGVKMVMDILDSSREGKGIALDAKQFDLSATVRELAREHEVAARQKGLAFTVTAPNPTIVLGDAEKLGRLVIKNLLDNAINYTPGGAVQIALTNDSGVVRLAVTDTGVGLSPSDMENLFTPGGKGESSSETNPLSTGYGLSIARQVVEAHGGRIHAESDGTGKGSTFIVELPAA